jgi:mycothiol synthase
VLRPFESGDAPVIQMLHAAHAEVDLVDVRSTVEPVLDADTIRHRMESADRAVVALNTGGDIVGWGALRSWTESDGTHVFRADGYVAPPHRRRGLGRRLLIDAEAAAGSGMLAGNASTAQPDRAALLERNGYRYTFSMVDMEHDGSPVAPTPVPEGITIRSATVADARALTVLSARAWAGRPFTTPTTEEWFRGWLTRSDLSLFRVAVAGDRVVGVVGASRTEIEDVEVDPDFQRRGLATALVTRTLAALNGPVRLNTEGHDPAGARSLYERLGFRVIREYRRYRKPTPAR